MSLVDRLDAPGPKRILALDGGGIRGAVTVGFLDRMESILREQHKNPDLVLSDYFDLIGGTSTGSIIAALLATGRHVSQIRELYLKLGGRIFGSEKFQLPVVGAAFGPKFSDAPLQEELKRFFGDMELGDPGIRTGLCIVTKRADTGSVWPLFNHPRGRYYDRNRHILLRLAIRASTAAPTYFKPEKFDVGGGQIGAFIDGGVSMSNNPSLQLFLLATLKGFPFRWPTGADRLLLVSIGTGTWSARDTVDNVIARWNTGWAEHVPGMLMEDASAQNELLLQFLSNSPTARKIDREVGDLSGDLLTPAPALSYLRYNATLEADALTQLGLPDLAVRAAELREMSQADNVEELMDVGRKAAEAHVDAVHFGSVFQLPQ